MDKFLDNELDYEEENGYTVADFDCFMWELDHKELPEPILLKNGDMIKKLGRDDALSEFPMSLSLRQALTVLSNDLARRWILTFCGDEFREKNKKNYEEIPNKIKEFIEIRSV